MGIWRVDIYDETDDPTPSRQGVVKANSEDEAVIIVTHKMGEAKRADITRTVVPHHGQIPDGYQEF